MVRMGSYAVPAVPPKSKEPATGKKKRKEVETGEGSAPLVELVPSAVSPVPPPAEGLPVAAAPLTIVPASTDQAVSTEEEVEEVEPPLKKKRVKKLGDLPTGPSGKGAKEKKKKGTGKEQAANTGQWESVLTLAKTATVGDLEVSRYIAERIIPPADDKMMDKYGGVELGSQLVRNSIRGATLSAAVLRHLEVLDQENIDLREQVKALKGELSEAKEGRDLLQAQNSSLEEEKKSREETMKSREEAMNVLEAQLASAVEEKTGAIMAKNDLIRVVEVLENKVRSEKELKEKFLQDCHAAVTSKHQTEDMLKEVRCSIRKQRVEAIKRWKRRNLNEECLELACEVTLTVLKRSYEVHFPNESERPSFEEYAKPLLPTLGLSLEEIKERVAVEPIVVPDEELDLSSEEEELPDEGVLPAASLDPASSPTVPPTSEASPAPVDPSAEAPVVTTADANSPSPDF